MLFNSKEFFLIRSLTILSGILRIKAHQQSEAGPTKAHDPFCFKYLQNPLMPLFRLGMVMITFQMTFLNLDLVLNRILVKVDQGPILGVRGLQKAPT